MISPILAAAVALAIGSAGNAGPVWETGGGTVPWGAIVVHHSGGSEGSAASLDEHARKVLRDPDGIDHHFVIGNGKGSPDGEVEATGAWTRGVVTTHLFRKGDLPPSIAVCLVGDFERLGPTPAQRRSLATLVAALSARFGIAAERVVTHREVEGRNTTCPGRYLGKLRLLSDAGLMHDGALRVRVETGAGRIVLLRGEQVLQRIALPPRAAGAGTPPLGSFPVCRRDAIGAFGETLVLAWPTRADLAAAKEAKRISREDAARIQAALAARRCPPDDTPLGGELAIHVLPAVEAAEPGPCIHLDETDMQAVYEATPLGTQVEIVP